MLFGHVRSHFGRLVLSLPGEEAPLDVEFIVDSGFEGELALPPALARRLPLVSLRRHLVSMADGTYRECPVGETLLEWQDETRPTEVLTLEGNPLLGMLLMDGSHIHIQATNGGEVLIEPL